MIVVGAAVGAALLVLWFRGVHEKYYREGVTVGILWLIINWALDIAILLPLSGSSTSSWFTDTGFQIPCDTFHGNSIWVCTPGCGGEE